MLLLALLSSAPAFYRSNRSLFRQSLECWLQYLTEMLRISDRCRREWFNNLAFLRCAYYRN